MSCRIGLAAALLVVAGCSAAPAPEQAADTTEPDPAGPGSSGSAAPPAELLADLVVAPEGPREGYDRDLFDHWITQPDGCSTRERVLIDEATAPPEVGEGCRVGAGTWRSVFDGAVVGDASDLDIDHLVPLAEAWDSGADAWDAARREAFANDLTHPEALVAVTASSNRSKSDQDPAEWVPPDAAHHCEYATAWVTVKVAWGLSADAAEVDALSAMLATCGES